MAEPETANVVPKRRPKSDKQLAALRANAERARAAKAAKAAIAVDRKSRSKAAKVRSVEDQAGEFVATVHQQREALLRQHPQASPVPAQADAPDLAAWFCRRCQIMGTMRQAMAGNCWHRGAGGPRHPECPLPPDFAGGDILTRALENPEVRVVLRMLLQALRGLS
jgi:archaeosine-15-forming tRNA-guanine transglycosylase